MPLDKVVVRVPVPKAERIGAMLLPFKVAPAPLQIFEIAGVAETFIG